MKVELGFLCVAWFVFLASSAVNSESYGIGEWQILTKQNFSSQIRLHPNILLIVTVPWSGESRTLMKEVGRLVNDRQEEFGSLKLMFMHRNSEKMLADAIGAMEGITVLYYHHSISYKYQGILRAQNILFSVHPYMRVLPEELPLKHLNTAEDVIVFLESTDKALLLLEFCGWTPSLLAKGKNNETNTEDGVGRGGSNIGDPVGVGFIGGTTPIPKRKNNQKGMENASMKCGIENGFPGIPWLGDFSSVNYSAPLQETENTRSGVGLSCTFEEFQRFDSFFSNFTTVAREFFFPAEKHRFGLVSNRSLLSSLGVEDSGSWLVMLSFAGCPSCSKILKEGDDLKSVLQTGNSLVTHLEGEGQDLVPSLPSDKPSVLLFVDRSSDIPKTRINSKEALDALRKLALHHQNFNQMYGQNDEKPDKSSVQVYQAVRSTSGHPRLKTPLKTQKLKGNAKMSIMILNEGTLVASDNIASDLQGSSLHEILATLLQQKKTAKISTLAKELGFQLLSDDFDVKIADTLPLETEVQSEAAPELSKEPLVTSNLDKDQSSYLGSMSAMDSGEELKMTDVRPYFPRDKEKTTSGDASTQLTPVECDLELAIAEDLKVADESSLQFDNLGEGQLQFEGFKGSFFFSDGNYRLLQALTSGSKIPSLVIIDPLSQRHYLFPEETCIDYSSLDDFLSGFLNGSLVPYQRSETVIQCPREATHPPFVNQDFHEVDSIPRVTVHTFSKLVIGVNQSETQNAANPWNKDVLVLFGNSWCGFCQRMELVVREVCRAMKGYMSMLKSGSRNGETIVSGDNLKDAMLKLPLIYLMDCTLNDCSLILKSMVQRDVYPALMLFPAERKKAVSYEGDIAVSDVIKFIANHGSNLHHLISDKGILWTKAEKGGRNQNLYKDTPPTTMHEETPVAEDIFHEVVLKDKVPKRVVKHNQIKSQTLKCLRETNPHVVVGSILIATEKLLSAHLFDKSMIVIVKADQNTGFQGLIINKHIRWDSLRELEKGLEQLKEAPLSFGGPLIKPGFPLVALTRRDSKEQRTEIIPGVYFLDQAATVHEIGELKSGNQSISDYWFFLGYSSWDWDQLFVEIAEGAWNISDDNLKHLVWP